MRSTILATLFASAAFGSAAYADPVADFYAGKTITLIISTGVGGGVDTNARNVAHHLGNHIPGKPLVVPKNMPGGGHLQAANYLYNVAAKNGLFIGAVLPTMVGYQVLDGRGAKYDVSNFNFLGSSDVENANLYVWHTLGIKSIEEVKTREVLMGATGAGSYTSVIPTLLNNVVGTKFKIVSGYKSTNEIHLAMERGEVAGRAGNLFTSLLSQEPDWVSQKKITMLLQIGNVRDPGWPDVPLLTELAANEEQRQILKVYTAQVALGKIFLTTPGVPADRLAALRKAFEDTVRDPAYIEDAKRTHMLVRPLTYQEVTEMVEEIVTMPPAVIAKAKAAVEQH